SIFGKSIFDATDYLVSNILLPIGCLLIAIFISFRMNPELVEKEFRMGNHLSIKWFKLWRVLMRYIIPIIIIIVFILSLLRRDVMPKMRCKICNLNSYNI